LTDQAQKRQPRNMRMRFLRPAILDLYLPNTSSLKGDEVGV
jgi:hypothetical protein